NHSDPGRNPSFCLRISDQGRTSLEPFCRGPVAADLSKSFRRPRSDFLGNQIDRLRVLCVNQCTGRGVVLMTVDELRARAQECDDFAKQTRDPLLKQGYQDLARQWREMADQLESRRK